VGGTNSEYDVIVVGAGPAGCAAGIAAVRQDLRTLLVHRNEKPGAGTCAGWAGPAAAELCKTCGANVPAIGTAVRGLALHSWDFDQSTEVDDAELSGFVVDPAALTQALRDATSAAGATIKLDREPVEEFLNSNITLMEEMIKGGYGDADTLRKRIDDVKEWLENGELMEGDPNAEYAAVIEIDLNEIKEPLLKWNGVLIQQDLCINQCSRRNYKAVRLKIPQPSLMIAYCRIRCHPLLPKGVQIDYTHRFYSRRVDFVEIKNPSRLSFKIAFDVFNPSLPITSIRLVLALFLILSKEA